MSFQLLCSKQLQITGLLKWFGLGSVLMSTLVLTACSSSTNEEKNLTDQVEQEADRQALVSEQAFQSEDSLESKENVESEEFQSTNNLELNANSDIKQSVKPTEPVKQLRPNISQQFIGTTSSQLRLAKAFPELPYNTSALPDKAVQVNSTVWTPESTLDENMVLKIQALLNYNHHSVGAVDGRFGKNVIKALQVFQEKQGLEATGNMNAATWELLTADSAISTQPVLVNYTLTDEDVTLVKHPKGQQFRTILEAVAEKFHMSQGLLLRLNPNIKFKSGNTLLVYNPFQPNAVPIHRVVAVKSENLLYAYDENNKLVASYPTSMGSTYKPSPSGEYKVLSRIKDPTYNRDFNNKDSVLPPGPNNPVGRVWIGINKPSYGIHGSPNPEKISRQNSSGCVRLTNWDALGLYGTIEEGAKVEFL